MPPIVEFFGIEQLSGFLVINAIAALALAGLVFGLGLLTYLPAISKRIERLDQMLADRVPGYSIVKGILKGTLTEDTSTAESKTVLVRMNNTARIGFEVERSPTGVVIVFLPDTPNPQTGTAAAFPAEEVEPLNLPPREAIEMLNFFGKGISGPVEEVQRKRGTLRESGAAGG